MNYRYLSSIISALAAFGTFASPRATAQEASVYDPAPAQVGAAGPVSATQPPTTTPLLPAATAAPSAQVGAAPGLPPGPPFELSDAEQQYVLQVLQLWETKSAAVQTFNSKFQRWEYDAVFGPGAETPLIKSTGMVSFSKPDKGSLKIEEISRWTKKNPQDTAADAPGDWAPQPHEIGEHWVCDGKAVYEYNHRDKQLVVTPIPEQMRGQGIVDGPLPFLFGAEAKKLSERYWLCTKKGAPNAIWLQAYPRRQSDAANYDYVDVMLDRESMQPGAIQVHLPGGQQRHAYMFESPKVNESNLGTWFSDLFSAPRKPLGWTRVTVESAPGPQAANPPVGVQR